MDDQPRYYSSSSFWSQMFSNGEYLESLMRAQSRFYMTQYPCFTDSGKRKRVMEDWQWKLHSCMDPTLAQKSQWSLHLILCINWCKIWVSNIGSVGTPIRFELLITSFSTTNVEFASKTKTQGLIYDHLHSLCSSPPLSQNLSLSKS